MLACSASGCASAPRSPYFGDEKYLRFGVDPRAEAKAVEKAHRDRGEQLVRRVEGQYFTALELGSGASADHAIRVVTLRGIELSLDGAYALMPPPFEHTADADGDGFEEIFVREARGGCLRVYRVRDVGFVDLAPSSALLFGQVRCATDLADVDRDGRAELIIDVRLSEDATPARVRVPLWARDHDFSRDTDTSAARTFFADEQRGRAFDLTEARRTLDVHWALRLALELAGLAHAAGEPAAEQVRTFDSALAGLVLDQAGARNASQARTRIYEAWNPAPSPAPSRAARNAADPRP